MSQHELIEGDRVHSSLVEVCTLPGSFNELCGPIRGEESWELGVGLRFNGDETVTDEEIARFFRQLGARQGEVVGVNSLTPFGAAVLDIASLSIAQYKQNSIFLEPGDHQLFGTVSRRYVTPEFLHARQGRFVDAYDDGLWHIDFVPPDDECEGYFFWDNNPTETASGGFRYRGPLTQQFYPGSDGDRIQARYDGTPYDSDAFPKSILGEGNRERTLNRTRDARTLIHRRHITEAGFRTFGRFFVGPVRRV